METRSRTRIRATSSPPHEVTEGGTQPVRDEFVDLSSSAIGLSGDGKISSRSTSVGAGPRRTCYLTASSERAGGTHGPAQGAEKEKNREIAETACSDIACISTTDARQISTYVSFCTNIQNLSQIPQSCAKLWLFFQNPRWRPPPCCFSKNDYFGHAFYYMLSFCTSVPNLIKIRLSTA